MARSPLFSQVWAVKNKGANLELKTFFDEKNLRLSSVSIAGTADRFAVQYFFADDGTTVTELHFKSTHNGAVVLVEEIVKSGKVVVAVRDYDGKLLKSTRFEKDKGRKVQVADALKRSYPFEFPDTMIAKPAAGAV